MRRIDETILDRVERFAGWAAEALGICTKWLVQGCNVLAICCLVPQDLSPFWWFEAFLLGLILTTVVLDPENAGSGFMNPARLQWWPRLPLTIMGLAWLLSLELWEGGESLAIAAMLYFAACTPQNPKGSRLRKKWMSSWRSTAPVSVEATQ